MPGEDFALARFALAHGIDAEFAEHQRLCAREHLQSREIILKRLAEMQVNIKTNEVDGLRTQKFSRRKGSERAEAVRVNRPGDINQFLDKIGDRADAAPPHDFRRNLVHHAVGEDGRVAPAGPGRLAYGVASLFSGFRRFEKANVFGPGNIHEYFEFILGRQI